MLNESQQVHLHAIVSQLGADVFVASARMDANRALELVLCREFVCFRPVQVTQGEVDIIAALDGDATAQQSLASHLRSKLEGLL